MRHMMIFILAVLLGGCSLSPVKVAHESTYTLTQWPELKSVNNRFASSKSILVTTPVAAPGYETASMIYLVVPYELRSFANNRWVAAPAKLLLPLIANHVRALGYFKGVVTPPFSGMATYQLNTRLLTLQQEFLQPQSQVRLLVQATLINMQTGGIVSNHLFQLLIPAKDNNPYGGVLAANKAANAVSTEIARWALRSIKKG